MKNRILALLLALLLLAMLCACSASKSEQSPSGTDAITEGEETEVDTANRKLLAQALGVEENARNLRFLIGSLNTIGAGQIRSAELSEENGEQTILVVAEDGTEYRIYLSSGSPTAVENLTTGEWPIQAYR